MNEKVTTKPASSHKKLNLSKKQKKIILFSGCGAAALLFLIYVSFAIYFSSHFLFGTTINGIDCHGMTTKEAVKAIQKYLDTYTLTIECRDSKTEKLESSKFDLQTVLTSDLSEFKEKQNGFAWPASLFKDYTYTADAKKSYDTKKLDNMIDKLKCMQDDNMKAPVNASLERSGNSYKIIAEVMGTTLDKEKTKATILETVEALEPTLNLEKKKCYVDPTYTSDSEVITDTIDQLNRFSSTKLTYNILGNTEIVSSELISSWLSWNEDFVIDISDTGVNELLAEWGEKYNTVGKPHTLNTSYGTTVTLDKGNYGWKIDTDSTRSELIAAIRNGETETKEPVYSSKASSKDTSKDYGNSYVEINLGTQHLFMYKDGQLIIETDLVSGKVTNGNATPTGIYKLTYKQSPAVLRGPGYASPVKYWMPFNGGVGMHDASWRGKFGGNIFYNNGSHGCINLPSAAAKTIYENISSGFPVLVYDEKIESDPLENITLSEEEKNAAANEQDANSAANAGITSDTPDVSVDIPSVSAPTQAPVVSQPTPAPTTQPTQTPTTTTTTQTPTPTTTPPTPTPQPTTPAPTATPTTTPAPTHDSSTTP